MSKTIVGVFDDAASAQNAVRALESSGIDKNHIRLTSNSETAPTAGATPTSGSWKDKIYGFFESILEHDNDRKHADNYAEAWRRGHFIVVADVANEQVDITVEILNRFGTVDIDRRVEQWKGSGYNGKYDQAAPAYTSEERQRELTSYQTERTVPVVQEELAVGKQVVGRGGVRIHSYVQERPVEELVRLREERIRVERRPVDRAAKESDLAFQERTVDVTAQGEEAVAEKRARVVEEVVVGKETEQREQTVTGTVRRNEVEVEEVDAGQAPEAEPNRVGGQRGQRR